MAQTGREQTDPISSGEDRRQMRLDVRILWNSPGKNVKLAPKKITCLTRRAGSNFILPDHASCPARSCSFIIHRAYSAPAPRPGQMLGHRGQRTPPGSLSSAPGQAPALPCPCGSHWGGGTPAPARGGSPLCCSGGPRLRAGAGVESERRPGHAPVAAVFVALCLGPGSSRDGRLGR